jgi:hypothetical protein
MANRIKTTSDIFFRIGETQRNGLAKLFYNKIGMERAFKFNKKKISRFLVFNRTMNKKPEWEGEI